MCPDPFNDIVDMLGIGIWLFLIIEIIISYNRTSTDLLISCIAFIVWTSLIILCYFFASRHSVLCGIHQHHPSRYEVWKEERNKTPEQKREDDRKRQENMARVVSIFNDLKEKGCIAPERELKFR